MNIRNPRERFIKYLSKLTSISEDKGKKKFSICAKIIKTLNSQFDEPINFDILLQCIDNISDRALYSAILKEIIENQTIEEEEKKAKYKHLLLTNTLLLSNEDKALKTECFKVATNFCKNINMKKPTLLMEYLIFECYLTEPINDYLKLIVHFLQNKIVLPKALIEFIIEIVIQFALVNRGKLSEYRSIFYIFSHYMLKVKSTKRFLKKIIIGILCLEYCLEPKQHKNTSPQWLFMVDFVKSNQMDTLDLLLDILKQYYTEQNCIKTLFNFNHFASYLIVEELNEESQKREKKIEQYQKRYVEYQRKLFEKENKKEKEVIRESVEIILSYSGTKNAIIEGTLLAIKQFYLFRLTNDQFAFEYPLINLLDVLKLIEEEKIIDINVIKIYIDLLMTVTIEYGEAMLNHLDDILLLCTRKFNQCLYFSLFKKDQQLAELGKIFTNKILSFVLRGLIPLNKFQFNEAISKSKRIIDRNNVIEDFIIKNPIVSESSIILKCLLLFENIEKKIEVLFKEYIIKLHFPAVNCYLFTVLKNNFLNNNRYSDLIEEYVLKHQTQCANAFCLQHDVLNTFTDLLTQVLLKTKKINKFTDALNALLIVNEPNTLLIFQVNTLLVLYNKLNTNYEYDKLQICNAIVFRKKMLMSNGTLKILQPFLKKMIVNRECEVLFTVPNNPPEEETSPSQLMLNIFDHKSSNNNNNEEQKETFVHYVLLNHFEIFDQMLSKADKLDINKEDKILESILEMFSIFTKQIFPLKATNMTQLIKVISKKEYYINNKSNNTIFSYTLSIVINLCYHLNSNLNKSLPNNNTSLLNIRNLCYKTDFLELMINTYCTLIDVIKADIVQNPKYSQNCHTTNKALDSALKRLNSLGNNNLKNVSTQESNKSQTSLRGYSNHNSSLSSNSSNNAKDINPQNQNTHEEYLLNPDIKMKLKDITTLFSTLHFYLNSITEYNRKSNHLPISSFPPSIQYYEKLSKIDSGNVRLDTLVKQLLNKITETLWLFQFKLRYGISIVSLLLGIKDFLFNMGDEVILKVIIIAMAIGWHQEDYGLVNIIETNFKINDSERLNKEFIIDLSCKSKRKRLQYIYLQYLADNLTLYFIEKFPYSTKLLQTINEMLNTIPEYSFRKYLFFEQCKWNLSMRTFRDNLKHHYRGTIAKDTQVILGKKNIIMLVPISPIQTELIIRNIIANINLSINATFENQNCVEALNILKKDADNNKQEKDDKTIDISKELNQADDIIAKKAINNSMIIFQQIINLTSESLDAFEYCPSNKIIDKLSLLDSESVYTVFYCGVVYAKSNCLNREYDLLSYDDEVSQDYIAFLHSLGDLYDITQNQQINVGNMDSKGANGNYVICHQDSLFQLVFHVSNLINCSSSDKEKSNAGLYSTRKSIISRDFVIIIWMENPYQKFEENMIVAENLIVYLILYPISPSYYLVKKKYNKPSDRKICRNIKKVLLDDFVININDPSSIMYFIQCIIQINMMHEYLLEFMKLDVEFGPDDIKKSRGIDEGLDSNYSRRHNVIVNITESK